MNISETEPKEPRSITLLLHCPTESDHYYTRLKWDVSSFSTTASEMAERLQILIGSGPGTEWSLHQSDQVLRMAVFLSKDPGCALLLTSHYVTETRDAGPIIEQDVLRVTHRHSVRDLIRAGRDVEKVVLSRAISSHLERRIIVHEGRTVVFH